MMNAMNAIAICLVFAALFPSGVWPPNPAVAYTPNAGVVNHPGERQQGEHVITKDGHRVIVVEYDEGGERNTKVSISTPEKQDDPGYFEESDKEKAAFRNFGQEKDHHGQSSSIGDAVGKATGKVSEAARTVFEEKKKLAYGAKDKLAEAARYDLDLKKKFAQGAKDKVAEMYDETKGKAADLRDAAGKKAHEIGEKSKETFDRAKESIDHAKDETVKRTKESFDNVKAMGDTLQGDIRGNLTQEGTIIKRMFSKVSSFGWVDDLLSGVQLLGFAMAYGTCGWVTFISSHILAGVLPRQQFGAVQSKIYPVYFRALASCIGLSLLGHVLGRRMIMFSNNAEIFQVVTLLASLLMVFANAFLLEPKATKTMFERMKLEKEDGRGRDRVEVEATAGTGRAEGAEPDPDDEAERGKLGEMSAKLKKLNTYSAWLNLATLISLSWNLVYLGQRLNVRC